MLDLVDDAGRAEREQPNCVAHHDLGELDDPVVVGVIEGEQRPLPEAAQRLLQVTTQFPKKRLALVVGDTMLAAPAYGSPVKDGRLIFMVGTEANALAAARAIAGPEATQTNGKK